MLLYYALHVERNVIERDIPTCPLCADLRMQQPSVQVHGFAQRGALRAQTAEVRRMLRIARNLDGIARGPHQEPTADAAIRAGRANWRALYLHQLAAASASAGPNRRLARKAVTSVPVVMRSKYHAPSRASP